MKSSDIEQKLTKLFASITEKEQASTPRRSSISTPSPLPAAVTGPVLIELGEIAAATNAGSCYDIVSKCIDLSGTVDTKVYYSI